ncbi:MAG: hypothetical protein RRC34_02895 [Lentisphaeria bacterium]|nr:hypothetical protein [Lentisphaeria bacterium]
MTISAGKEQAAKQAYHQKFGTPPPYDGTPEGLKKIQTAVETGKSLAAKTAPKGGKE